MMTEIHSFLLLRESVKKISATLPVERKVRMIANETSLNETLQLLLTFVCFAVQL